MNDIRAWVDMITCDKSFDDIEIVTVAVPVNCEDMPCAHVLRGIEKLAKALNCDLIRSDWAGNEQCNSSWDELWFVYNGYKFFTLLEKES